MKIVVMVDKSAGNEAVGDMWTETHIFDESTTLKDVILKISNPNGIEFFENGKKAFLKNVKIQIGREHAN